MVERQDIWEILVVVPNCPLPFEVTMQGYGHSPIVISEALGPSGLVGVGKEGCGNEPVHHIMVV